MTTRFDANGYLEAWRRRDPERILSFHSDGFVMEDPVVGRAGDGKGYMQGLFESDLALMDELDVDPRTLLQSDEQVGMLLRVHASYARDQTLSDGTVVPLAGKRLAFDLAVFLDVEMGKITHETWLYDVASAFAQMGVSTEDVERIVRNGPLAAYAAQWPTRAAPEKRA